jgi:hypothetical protein
MSDRRSPLQLHSGFSALLLGYDHSQPLEKLRRGYKRSLGEPFAEVLLPEEGMGADTNGRITSRE